MDLKTGQKVRISTPKELHKKIKRKGNDISILDNINFDFFQKYGNAVVIVEKFSGGNVILSCNDSKYKPRKISVLYEHIPYALNFHLELDKTLFEL